MRLSKINKNKGRPVNPNNHVKRGVRQGLFPYKVYNNLNFINFSFDKHERKSVFGVD